MKNNRYEIIWLIRRLFRALSQKSSEHLEGTGISVAERAVLEFLFPDSQLTVPDIAEKYKVSRQHIQSTVNGLVEKSLIEANTNPRHKRSPLISLNRKGIELFGSIIENDKRIVDSIFEEISHTQIETTKNTLLHLLKKLN